MILKDFPEFALGSLGNVDDLVERHKAFFSLHDIDWAAGECARQNSGEWSVQKLLVALWQLREQGDIPRDQISKDDIWRLGYLVHPANRFGDEAAWRKRQVFVERDGGLHEFSGPDQLDRLMEKLIEAWGTLSADEWYRNFEEIHPFLDGNGRVGSLLWNLHRGSLGRLQTPPDFWT